ncbi:hypothetical protein E4U47_002696 [Claviceps purpurea]|nr:hypothetical protein E4U47_002696 [Claviceps purpurea]
MGRSSRSVAWTYKWDRCYPVSTSSAKGRYRQYTRDSTTSLSSFHAKLHAAHLLYTAITFLPPSAVAHKALLKPEGPHAPTALIASPSPWQAEQKEVNLEDIEKMKVEEDDSDSEDEGSLGQPALPQEQTLVSLGALESYLHDVAVPLGFDVARSKWYGRKNEASGKMSRLYFRCCRGSKQECRRKVDS